MVALIRRTLYLVVLLIAAGTLTGARQGEAGGEQSLIETLTPLPLISEKQSELRAGQRGVFVGKVAGSEAFIGIKIRGDRVLVYLCDQEVDPSAPPSRTPPPGDGTIWRWLEGEIVNGVSNLTSAGGVEVTLEVGARAITGSATFAGESHPFRAVPAKALGAGLYRSHEPVQLSGKTVYRGWIVLNNGEINGDRRRLYCFSWGFTICVGF